MSEITLALERDPRRRCGACTLCCKLLPTKELDKPANQRCQHQRHGGCKIYQTRPMSCRLWSCRWLTGAVPNGISRPDFAHYVVDMMPDYVTIVNQDTGERGEREAVQIWIDPKYPSAWRDQTLLDWLEATSLVGMMRTSERTGTIVFPPSVSSDRQWHEIAMDDPRSSVGEVRPIEDQLMGVLRARS